MHQAVGLHWPSESEKKIVFISRKIFFFVKISVLIAGEGDGKEHSPGAEDFAPWVSGDGV